MSQSEAKVEYMINQYTIMGFTYIINVYVQS